MSEVMNRVDERTQMVGRNRLELLLFYLGDQQCFGINVFKVREVIECPTLIRMPDSHANVCGVANIRGRTIIIVDLASMVGKHVSHEQNKCRVIVTEYNRSIQGFLVSDVARIVNLNWEEIKAPPSGIGNASFLTAVTKVKDKLVEILDVEKILAEILDFTDEISSNTLQESETRRNDINHVLVVDDSSMARKQMCRVLEQLQLPHTVLTNGKEAYEQLLAWAADDSKPLQQHCNLIVSDVEMPEMDGYTLCKKIKEHPDLKSLPIMLHSSLSGTFNESMVRKVGANDFLAKYNPDELAGKILQHLKIERQ